MIYSGRVSLVSADLIWHFLWESCCHLDVVWMAASAIVMAFVFVLLTYFKAASPASRDVIGASRLAGV